MAIRAPSRGAPKSEPCKKKQVTLASAALRLTGRGGSALPATAEAPSGLLGFLLFIGLLGLIGLSTGCGPPF